jgi:hypothetical protein
MSILYSWVHINIEGDISSHNRKLKLVVYNRTILYWKIGLYIGITGFLDFVHRPVFQRTLKKTTFWKLDLFPSWDDWVGDTYSVESVRKN